MKSKHRLLVCIVVSHGSRTHICFKWKKIVFQSCGEMDSHYIYTNTCNCIHTDNTNVENAFLVDVCHWNQYTNTWLRTQNYVHSFSSFIQTNFFFFFFLFFWSLFFSVLLCCAWSNVIWLRFCAFFLIYCLQVYPLSEYTQTNISQQHWIWCVMKCTNFFFIQSEMFYYFFLQFPLFVCQWKF